jgi:hypothetical protein
LLALASFTFPPRAKPIAMHVCTYKHAQDIPVCIYEKIEFTEPLKLYNPRNITLCYMIASLLYHIVLASALALEPWKIQVQAAVL